MWHRIAGGASIGLGFLLIMVNFAEQEDLGILPGGHSILYFMAGLVLAASSLWWFGAFDPGP